MKINIYFWYLLFAFAIANAQSNVAPVLIATGKAWYIYYYFKNPLTGKMEKIMDTCKINKFKTIKERTAHGRAWVKAYEILLAQGFNPFTKNGIETQNFNQEKTIIEALDYGLLFKKGELKESTISDYNVRIGVFKNWIINNNLHGVMISDFKDVYVVNFMNWLLLPKPHGRGVGKTSQDNYKRALSTVFAKLKKDKIISTNIVDYETSKDDPIKNKPFTNEQLIEIKNYLLKNDVQLYYFICFVFYQFLRNREVIRLRVKNINLKERTLFVDTKTKRKKIKRLVSPIVDILNSMDLSKQDANSHLFTNNGLYNWDAKEKTKVDFFSDRFNKVKKHFSFGSEYGIYSFRHAAALNIYYSLTKKLTHDEAVNKLKEIIGHTNTKTTEIYLRGIEAMLPKDYSKTFTVDF